MFPTFVAQSLSISKLHHHQQLTIVKSKKNIYAGWWFQLSTPPKNISQWEGLSMIIPYIMEN
jgi:hypothetical protein